MTGTRRMVEVYGRGGVVAAVIGAALVAGVARADEVKFPAIHPDVAMDVPAGWTIDMRPDGVQMTAPEKNSIIVANIVYNEKALIDGWSRFAASKLQAFGVVFDKNAKAPPKTATSEKPDVAPVTGSSAFTTDPNAFTFTGKPSLAMPGRPDSNDPVLPAETSIENLTNFGTKVEAPVGHLPFRAVQYYGTTLNGKTVDVQLVAYTLPDKRYFLMMQESGGDDSRAVEIAKSVRAIK